MPSLPSVAREIKRVHVWVPELVSKRGGIQTFSRCLIEALVEILGHENVRVMAKNDSQEQGAGSGGLGVALRGWGRWPAILRTPVFFFGIILRAIRDRPDLVISTHLNFGIAGYVLKVFGGPKYWCVAHGVEAWNLHRYLPRLGLLKSDLVLAVSNYTRQRLLKEQQLRPDQVVVLPNTIDPEAIKPGPKPEYLMRRHALTVRDKIILTVARLAEPERYKGYDQILRALPVIRREVPNLKYILVGEGEDRSRIEDLIRELNICDAVVLAGGVPQKELAGYYNLCDVFAMPSKGEGFGIVYLEALVCGKPVLAGNSDGSSEPLQNGELGVLVNVDDVSQIATNLVAILGEQRAGGGEHGAKSEEQREGSEEQEAGGKQQGARSKEHGVKNGARLREETLRKFGFDAFKSRLSNLLHQGWEHGAGCKEE